MKIMDNDIHEELQKQMKENLEGLEDFMKVEIIMGNKPEEQYCHLQESNPSPLAIFGTYTALKEMIRTLEQEYPMLVIMQHICKTSAEVYSYQAKKKENKEKKDESI